MSTDSPSLEEAELIKVSSLRPDLQNFSLRVKVVTRNLVLDKPATTISSSAAYRVAECVVGDETGVIVLVAKNDQADIAQEGRELVISNGRIDMFKGSMRLAVGQIGTIVEAKEALVAKPDVDHNLSLIEFESVLLPTQNGPAS